MAFLVIMPSVLQRHSLSKLAANSKQTEFTLSDAMNEPIRPSSTQSTGEIFRNAFGDFKLRRWPLVRRDKLQAWDASDELILQHLSDNYKTRLQQLESSAQRILIVNDAFGALSTCLYQYGVCNWGDSKISQMAVQNNINQPYNISRHVSLTNQKNKLSLLSSTSIPNGDYGIALIKIPKTSALLKQQLLSIKTLIKDDCVIIGASMTKHIHNSTLKLFSDVLGTTKSSLAKKKARLIFSQIDDSTKGDKPVQLKPYSYYCKELEGTLTSYANGFSKNNLDLGTRAMLTAIKNNRLPEAKRLLDLACGNGVLGICAAKTLSDNGKGEISIDFIDESYMAVAASQTNCSQFISSKHSCKVNFIVEDGISHTEKKYDWIICNPPFHRGNTIETQTAKRLFRDSHRHLENNGELWIVGNHHLKYHQALEKIFSNYRLIFSDHRFSVIAAKKINQDEGESTSNN